MVVDDGSKLIVDKICSQGSVVIVYVVYFVLLKKFNLKDKWVLVCGLVKDQIFYCEFILNEGT
jgi:hypothetical protein